MTDFRSALLTLGDDAFFELLRNYLGPIKTPFNKHDLITRLESFLRRPEIQTRIVELIDDEDAELLTAVWMLAEPTFDELFLLFSVGRSYLDMHNRLLNLEDRLLVYRVGNRVRINPLLEPELRSSILRPERLFASRELRAEDPEPTGPWLTDTLLASVYSWASERPEVFRADGTLRKRALGDLGERIPVLVEPLERVSRASDEEMRDTARPAVAGEPRPARATFVLDALRAVGALTGESGVQVVEGRWRELASRSPLRRLATLVAALAIRGTGSLGSLPEAIEVAVTALPRGRALDAVGVERLLLVLASEHSGEICRRAREAMFLCGMLTETSDGLAIAPPLPDSDPAPTPLVVQPNFELTLPEEIEFDDALFVAGLARLVRHDRYPRFELTRARLAGALRDGRTLEELIERLNTLSARRVPQNVVVTVRSWATEYESVRLFRGVVLTVDAARRHAVDHAEPIRRLIRRELAPGVYLLDERDVDALRSALGDAGFELVPELPDRPEPPDFSLYGSQQRSVDRRRIKTLTRAFAGDGGHRTEVSAGGASKGDEAKGRWLEEIEQRLEDRPLSSEQREELTARVRRKLIVSADQIVAGALRTEKTEARGLDYVGKVRVIEHAIRTGTSFLEIIERTDDGSPRRRLVEPHSLAKQGDELLLSGEELPERNAVELRVRKLGLVRRLRAGLVSRRAHRQ